MAVEIVTKEDLELFRQKLLKDISAIISPNTSPVNEVSRGFKTREVLKILGCCRNTLNKHVIKRKIRRKKEEGSYYYNKEDIMRMVNAGFNE